MTEHEAAQIELREAMLAYGAAGDAYLGADNRIRKATQERHDAEVRLLACRERYLAAEAALQQQPMPPTSVTFDVDTYVATQDANL